VRKHLLSSRVAREVEEERRRVVLLQEVCTGWCGVVEEGGLVVWHQQHPFFGGFLVFIVFLSARFVVVVG